MSDLLPIAESDNPIRKGVNPVAILREQGHPVERSNFWPEIPDYFGYLVGMILIWLIWTFFRTVVTVVSDPSAVLLHLRATPPVTVVPSPIAPVNHQEVLQPVAKQSLVPPSPANPVSAAAVQIDNNHSDEKLEKILDKAIEAGATPKEKGWKAKIEGINSVIKEGTEYLADTVNEMLDGSQEQIEQKPKFVPRTMSDKKPTEQLEKF